MLEGTSRAPDDVVAVVPPNLEEITVEKVAINGDGGSRPEYLPVVIAAVEVACNDTFNMHGVLATTMPVGPVIIVNGPIRRAGMNLWATCSVREPGQHRSGAPCNLWCATWAVEALRRRSRQARQPRQSELLLRRGRGRLAVELRTWRARLPGPTP
jgi:hypothetical protein